MCGSTSSLELDHIDRNTKVTHRIWSWSEARRNEEIAKCQILCEDCHQSKTVQQLSELNSLELVHGTRRGYDKGCRCNRCHDALVLWWRMYRAGERIDVSLVCA
jgi:hypothetical protein